MTTEQKTFLRDMAEKYDLVKDDFFKQESQGWVIIKRTGIDKIQAKAAISVSFEIVKCELDLVVIKATGKLDKTTIESYGESNKQNCKNSYFVAMAEKRALSRVILKLIGAYAEGIYSEDESDEFKV